jgi:hypothetical protein
MFYLGLLKMMKDNKKSLVMRDIASDNNVFINNTTLTLIDFENLTITNSIVQIVNILTGKCYNRDFINLFLQSKHISEIKKNRHKLSIFRSMLFYGAIVEMVEAKKEKRGLPYEFPVELLNISLSPKLKRNNKSGLSFNNVFNLFDGYKFMKGVLINNE